MRRICGFAVLFMIAYSASVCLAEEIFDFKAAATHIEKGINHLRAKEYDAAIAEFEEAAAIHPEAEPFYYLGYAYYLKGKSGDEESRKRAIENFEKAYDIDPNFTPAKLKPADHDTMKQEIQEHQEQEKTAEEPTPKDAPETGQPVPAQQ